MTTIGGPGGIHGPKGPGGSTPTDPTDASDASSGPVANDVTGDTKAADVGALGGADEVGRATAADLGAVQALAAEVAAGKLTPREAIDRMVAATADPGLGAAERAELRALLTDLVANDPVLGALVGRI
jgi:hypothetical protein